MSDYSSLLGKIRNVFSSCSQNIPKDYKKLNEHFYAKTSGNIDLNGDFFLPSSEEIAKAPEHDKFFQHMNDLMFGPQKNGNNDGDDNQGGTNLIV